MNMTLAQMIEAVSRKSYRSRTQTEVIEAINSAARRVFNWIVKETPGKHFLKFDTSLTLIAAATEYALPVDCRQIARIREYDPASGKWRIIHSTDLVDIGNQQEEFGALVQFDDTESPFKFYGPYQKATGLYYIMIEPATDVNRTLEIVYSAAYVDITDQDSTFVMPEESHPIIQNFALAECLEDNDDSLSQAKETRAEKDLVLYADKLRDAQTQDRPTQEAYL
jgi:hypothetical protein